MNRILTWIAAAVISCTASAGSTATLSTTQGLTADFDAGVNFEIFNFLWEAPTVLANQLRVTVYSGAGLTGSVVGTRVLPFANFGFGGIYVNTPGAGPSGSVLATAEFGTISDFEFSYNVYDVRNASGTTVLGRGNYTTTPSTVVVPLPATLPFALAGLGVLGAVRLRRARRA